MLNDVWIRDNDGIVHHSQVREVRQWTLPILLLSLILVGSLPGMIMSIIESINLASQSIMDGGKPLAADF